MKAVRERSDKKFMSIYERKWHGDAKNYVVKSFIICSIQLLEFGLFNQEGRDSRDVQCARRNKK